MSMTAAEVRAKITETEQAIKEKRDELGDSWSSGDATERAMMNRYIQQSIYCLGEDLRTLHKQLDNLNKPKPSYNPRLFIDLTKLPDVDIIDLTGDDNDDVQQRTFQ